MWSSYEEQKTVADIADLQLAAHRRRIMLCNAAAWYWLTQSCVQRCRAIVAALILDSNAYATSDHWLERLCTAVYTDLKKRRKADYKPEQFIPNLPGTPQLGHVPRPRRVDPEKISELVCELVTGMLRNWLSFPNNTEMFAAYFILYVVCALRNSDVLLLDGVWRTYRSVKAAVLGEKRKAASVRIQMLEPFASAVQSLPLARQDSEEALIMRNISEIVESCMPGVRTSTEFLVNSMNTADFITESSSPATQLPIAHAGPAPRASPSRSPSPSVLTQAALSKLSDFALHVLPIALGQKIVQPSRLQANTLKRLDHYLPFRELAPSRQRVTAQGGPFHPTQLHKPGAFPSWVIFRALLFNSEVLHDSTQAYFATHPDWEQFLEDEGLDETDTNSLDRFFNISCYGTRQAQRREGKRHAEQYFAMEPKWVQLLEDHNGGPIPFLKLYYWLQGKKEVPSKTPSKPASYRDDELGVALPIVGTLTAYLLAADLAYAGLAEMPTMEEVAFVIRKNTMGSFNALLDLKLFSTKKPTAEEVQEVFGQVYAHIRDIIPAEHHSRIGLDVIMVEHLLCKYHRTKAMKRTTK